MADAEYDYKNAGRFRREVHRQWLEYRGKERQNEEQEHKVPQIVDEVFKSQLALV